MLMWHMHTFLVKLSVHLSFSFLWFDSGFFCLFWTFRAGSCWVSLAGRTFRASFASALMSAGIKPCNAMPGNFLKQGFM